MIIPTETNIIFAIIGSIGVLATIIIWLRANSITSNYYSKK